MKPRLTEEAIALRVLKEFKDGDYVNLGMGIPLLCALNPPPDKEVFFHAQQGVLGYTRLLLQEEWEMACSKTTASFANSRSLGVVSRK